MDLLDFWYQGHLLWSADAHVFQILRKVKNGRLVAIFSHNFEVFVCVCKLLRDGLWINLNFGIKVICYAQLMLIFFQIWKKK